MRTGIPHEPGQLAIRGDAAYRLAEAFGMRRTPPAAISGGPYGAGLVQDFVPSHDIQPLHLYDQKQQQQMAFLDYVMGYTDGNPNNYRTALSSKYFEDGDLVGIDRDLIAPEEPDPRWGIRSPFVDKYLGDKLDSDILESAHSVPADRIPEIIGDFGEDMPRLSDRSIEGVQARLLEVQSADRITGAAWPGIITSDPI